MASPKVVVHSVGVVALLNDPGVTAELVRRMTPALSTARANAPVATGAYRDSLHLEVVRHRDRTVVHLVSTVAYAMSVEAATGNLSRALDQSGGA